MNKWLLLKSILKLCSEIFSWKWYIPLLPRLWKHLPSEPAQVKQLWRDGTHFRNLVRDSSVSNCIPPAKLLQQPKISHFQSLQNCCCYWNVTLRDFWDLKYIMIIIYFKQELYELLPVQPSWTWHCFHFAAWAFSMIICTLDIIKRQHLES